MPSLQAETIYSEYLDTLYDGKGDSFPPKQEFIMYEAYMDDNGNSTRPYSTRAAHMLLRPESYGPMLIVKVVCVRDKATGEVQPVRFEPLPASELESEEFRNKRRRYSEKEAVYHKHMIEMIQSQGGVVVSL